MRSNMLPLPRDSSCQKCLMSKRFTFQLNGPFIIVRKAKKAAFVTNVEQKADFVGNNDYHEFTYLGTVKLFSKSGKGRIAVLKSFLCMRKRAVVLQIHMRKIRAQHSNEILNTHSTPDNLQHSKVINNPIDTFVGTHVPF